MKFLFLMILHPFFVTADTNGCRDSFSKSYCEAKKNEKSCYLKFVKYGCMLTCGICIPGVTPSCGTVSTRTSRVVKGTTADPGAWPWQAGIRFRGRYHCGGALITPSWIISAARCVENSAWPGNYTAVLGASNMMVVEASWQKRRITKLVHHPQNRLLYNDLVLMKLETPVMLNDRVRTICLPSPFKQVAVGSTCYLSGWGQIQMGGKPFLQLQQSALPVVDNDECRAKNSRKTPILITTSMICAGRPATDTEAGCHGDNGSPLVCHSDHDGSFVLRGVASWGSSSCNATDVYTVFSRISKYRWWIDSVISK